MSVDNKGEVSVTVSVATLLSNETSLLPVPAKWTTAQTKVVEQQAQQKKLESGTPKGEFYTSGASESWSSCWTSTSTNCNRPSGLQKHDARGEDKITAAQIAITLS